MRSLPDRWQLHEVYPKPRQSHLVSMEDKRVRERAPALIPRARRSGSSGHRFLLPISRIDFRRRATRNSRDEQGVDSQSKRLSRPIDRADAEPETNDGPTGTTSGKIGGSTSLMNDWRRWLLIQRVALPSGSTTKLCPPSNWMRLGCLVLDLNHQMILIAAQAVQQRAATENDVTVLAHMMGQVGRLDNVILIMRHPKAKTARINMGGSARHHRNILVILFARAHSEDDFARKFPVAG